VESEQGFDAVLAMPGISHDSVAPPRCVRCGEVVGVYEPTVRVVGEIVDRTSRAADPLRSDDPTAVYYHRDCYSGVEGQ
jgi:hypothetical protein